MEAHVEEMDNEDDSDDQIQDAPAQLAIEQQ